MYEGSNYWLPPDQGSFEPNITEGYVWNQLTGNFVKISSLHVKAKRKEVIEWNINNPNYIKGGEKNSKYLINKYPQYK
jgi:hypothetical protein